MGNLYRYYMTTNRQRYASYTVVFLILICHAVVSEILLDRAKTQVSSEICILAFIFVGLTGLLGTGAFVSTRRSFQKLPRAITSTSDLLVIQPDNNVPDLSPEEVSTFMVDVTAQIIKRSITSSLPRRFHSKTWPSVRGV
jgi:hypothetical protein